jgi:sulfotransferase family protein
VTEDPIVLVGMPRSGSTVCSAVLNQSPQVYLINDAYFLQGVDEKSAWNGFKTDSDAQKFLEQIESLIITRSAVRNQKALINSARMTADQLESACREISRVETSNRQWHTILDSAMTIASTNSQKTRWGWNTPQDIYHIERILNSFPRAQLIFLMRDPFAVLKSFKNKQNTNAARRYHPLAQALAWKKAAKILHDKKASHPEKVLLMKYEDLVNSTADQITRMNDFLDVSIPVDLNLALLGTNSSFRERQKTGNTKPLSEPSNKVGISGMEAWLTDRVLFEERQSLGYLSDRRRFSIRGSWGLLVQTMRFFNYYLAAFISSPNIRKRIFRFLK